VSVRATTRAWDVGIVLALAIAALLFWKLRIFDPALDEPFYRNLTNVDFFTYEVPVGAAAGEALRQGRIPLWNPHQFAGHPFLASVPFGVLYPGNLPFVFLPASLAIEVTVMLHLIAAGLFLFLYARSIPLGRPAAAVAATTFMLGGFLSSQAVWFTPALAACVWLPLAFLAIERIFRKPGFSASALLAVAIAMPILAGWLQTWTYSMYAVASYASIRLGVRVWGQGAAAATRPLLLLAAGGLLGIGLASVQLIPSLELQTLTPRHAGGLTVRQTLVFGGTAPAKLLADAINPAPGQPRWVYLGLGALVLIPLSLLATRARALVACLWLLGALGLGLALGVHTPIFAVFRQLPTGSWFRAPQRALYLFAFAGSLLAGFGFQTLLDRQRRVNREARPGAGWWLAPVGVTIAAAALHALELSLRGFVLLGTIVAAAWAIAVLPASGTARKAAVAALVAVVFFDLFGATRNPFKHPLHEPTDVVRDQAVLEFVRSRQGYFRTYVHNPNPFDFSMMAKQATRAGLFSITDYEPLSLERFANVFRSLDARDASVLEARPFTGMLKADPLGSHFARLDLFSVRFLLAPRANQAFLRALAPTGWKPMSAAPSGRFAVFEHPDPLPRAYVAFETRRVEGPDAAFRAILAPGFDPRRQLVLESPGPAGTGKGGIAPARILEYGPSQVVVESEADRPGFLVLTDTYYPGWEATVDGEPVTLERANYLFRAVPVAAGRHRVSFRYRPASFRWGAGLSLAALLTIALAAVRARLSQRRLATAAAALLAILVAGCGGAPPRPNVLVVVVDTLRQDGLGSYGHSRDLSPRMDALAREGVRFEEAVTVAPRTWQSFTSILTGLYPPHHGVRAIFSRPLGPGTPTLASLLSDAGYHTAAFDGMTFLREMTGGHGFQQFVDPRSLRSGNPTMGDDAVMESFLNWLESSREPFFAFIRLTAPHWTYWCKPVFHSEVEDHDAIDHAFNAGSHGLGRRQGGLSIKNLDAYRERFYGLRLTPAEGDHMRLHYDECVHSSDVAIGRAIDRLRERGDWDSTLVVVTSDHGESFGEHGYLSHGPQVDGPVMRVPLLIRFPKSLAEGRSGVEVSQLVRTVDLLPTIAQLLGLPVPPGIDGTSLLPAIDEDRDLALSAYGEAGRSFPGIDRDVYLPGVAGKWRMLRTRDWKLIHIPDGNAGIDRLYHLAPDPGEFADVADQHPERVAELRRLLDPILAADAGAQDGSSLSEEEKQRLRALGYL